MSRKDYFSIGAIQPEVYYCETREQIYEKNMKRHLELLDNLVPYWSGILGARCKLVAFPEFAIQGYPQKEDGSWNGVTISIPGEETDMLSKAAKKHGVHIAAHAWEEYPDFPGRPFSVAFLINPDGEVILKHHKVVTAKNFESGSAAPSDAYDWFVQKFGEGLDAFFPVAETELGKIGFVICNDGDYPEVSRGLMMNGAEILIRPNAWGEPWMTEPMNIMDVISRYNAYANMCYMLESNWSYYYGPHGPNKGSGPGRSQVIDYVGRVLARTHATCESGVAAGINMQSLRRHREESHFGSRIVHIPTYIFKKIYETELWPKNSLMKKTNSNIGEDWEKIRREVIERRRDIYTPSED
jgi:predicted amidohydrolase